MSVREPATGYYANIIYYTNCQVALQIIHHISITDRYHLYETNIDLGPDVNSRALSHNTTLYILAVRLAFFAVHRFVSPAILLSLFLFCLLGE